MGGYPLLDVPLLFLLFLYHCSVCLFYYWLLLDYFFGITLGSVISSILSVDFLFIFLYTSDIVNLIHCLCGLSRWNVYLFPMILFFVYNYLSFCFWDECFGDIVPGFMSFFIIITLYLSCIVTKLHLFGGCLSEVGHPLLTYLVLLSLLLELVLLVLLILFILFYSDNPMVGIFCLHYVIILWFIYLFGWFVHMFFLVGLYIHPGMFLFCILFPMNLYSIITMVNMSTFFILDIY